MKTVLKIAAVIAALILYIVFFGFPLHAQRNNSYQVDQFPGATVAAKTIKTQAACSPTITCVLIFDPVLGAMTEGSMPAKGANEIWLDFRFPFAATIPTDLVGSSSITGTLPIVVSPAKNISINAATNAAIGASRPDGTSITAAAGVLTVPTATNAAKGISQPDGTSISAAAGILTVPTATNGAMGISRPDGSTITAALGVLTVPSTTVNGITCTPGTPCTLPATGTYNSSVYTLVEPSPFALATVSETDIWTTTNANYNFTGPNQCLEITSWIQAANTSPSHTTRIYFGTLVNVYNNAQAIANYEFVHYYVCTDSTNTNVYMLREPLMETQVSTGTTTWPATAGGPPSVSSSASVGGTQTIRLTVQDSAITAQTITLHRVNIRRLF